MPPSIYIRDTVGDELQIQRNAFLPVIRLWIHQVDPEFGGDLPNVELNLDQARSLASELQKFLEEHNAT